ncbi:MAG: mechanosensitive ion channel domain-containing protein [Eubacterium sp.]
MDYFKNSLPGVLDFLIKLIIAIIVLLIGRKIIKVVRKIVKRMMEKTSWDEGVKQFFDNLLNAFLHFVLVMIVLGKFGITASSVIAVIGSVGLSIGLALQGSLSNFAGGVLILILRPFKVGDYIVEDTHGNEGTVTEIQLFYTKLLTIDNRTVILPNGNLSNCSLTNITQQDKRRIDIIVGISYDADIRQAKNVIETLILEETARIPEEAYSVYVDSLGESAVNIGARVWVKTEDYWETKWRLTENIKYALDENHIEIPYPQMSVHMRQSDSEN